eukprot:4930983-Amphidinium_carterae.1
MLAREQARRVQPEPLPQRVQEPSWGLHHTPKRAWCARQSRASSWPCTPQSPGAEPAMPWCLAPSGARS